MKTIVIGAGLQGICTAYFLRRAGVQVTVIEKSDGPARGASYGNGGYIQAACPSVWNRPGIWRTLPVWWGASLSSQRESRAMLIHTKALPGLMVWGTRFMRNSTRARYVANTVHNFELAAYSQSVAAEIRDAESFEYHARQAGAIWVFRDTASFLAYRPLLDHLGTLGTKFEALAADDVVAVEPSLAPIAASIAGAYRFPDDDSGDPALFCAGLEGCARRDAVDFRYELRVESVEPTRSGVTVTTDRGAIEADNAVLCSGAWSPAIARSARLSLPIAPAKGCSISVRIRDRSAAPRHVVADTGVHACVNLLGDRLRAAGTAEFAGYDWTMSTARADFMLSLLESVFPALANEADRNDIKPWTGLRPLSPDGLPMIGPTRMPNLYANTGHGGLGWSQAPGSAKALADMMTGSAPRIDLAPFDPRRF